MNYYFLVSKQYLTNLDQIEVKDADILKVCTRKAVLVQGFFPLYKLSTSTKFPTNVTLMVCVYASAFVERSLNVLTLELCFWQ